MLQQHETLSTGLGFGSCYLVLRWAVRGAWLLSRSSQMAKVASSFLDLPAWLKTGGRAIGPPRCKFYFFQLRFFCVQADRWTLCESMCRWVHMLRRIQPGHVSICFAVCCTGAVELCDDLLCKSKCHVFHSWIQGDGMTLPKVQLGFV